MQISRPIKDISDDIPRGQHNTELFFFKFPNFPLDEAIHYKKKSIMSLSNKI